MGRHELQLEQEVLGVGASAERERVGAGPEAGADCLAGEDTSEIVGAVPAEAAGCKCLAREVAEARLIFGLGQASAADADADANAVGLEISLLEV